VRDQVVSLIAAGHDTTSAGIAWTVHAVHTHPEVRDRARAEVRSVVGDDPLTVEHLAALPYLDAVVSESLRLWPPGPFSARKAIDAFDYGGRTIPAGRLVVYSAYETHRDPDVWPDPLHFDPDRWIPGSPTHHEPGPYDFVPFGGGYRRCIGFALATQEIKATLVEVLRRVDLEPLDAQPTPTGIATMSPRGGLPCRVRPRV
jgi:cytochrome P450